MIQIDMEMPNRCDECPLSSLSNECPLINIDCDEEMGGRDLNCPLKEIPTGKWEIKDNMWWICSNCGCRTRMIKKYNVPNYCPACGAKMVEEHQGENK